MSSIDERLARLEALMEGANARLDSISKALNYRDERIRMIEGDTLQHRASTTKQIEMIESRLEEIIGILRQQSEKIQHIERWRASVMGMATAVSAFISLIVALMASAIKKLGL